MVDLKETYFISRLTLLTGSEKLIGSNIFVSTNPFTDTVNGNVCAVTSSSIVNWVNVTCSSTVQGRYLKIVIPKMRGWINLCDVDIEECDDGWYGSHCNSSCHCLGGEVCNKATGSCSGQCDLGFYGEACDETCLPGSFGSGCINKCMCHNNPCDITTGVCSEGCQSGYFGIQCQTGTPTLAHITPTVSSVAATSLVVEWVGSDTPLSNNASMFYRVIYYNHSSPNETFNITVPHQPNQPVQLLTVPKLQKNTYYDIYVEPYVKEEGQTGEIKGGRSQTISYIRTKCTDPSSPSILHYASGTNQTANQANSYINVTWQPSSEINCDSLLYYQVSYRDVNNDDEWRTKTVGPNHTSYQINNLNDGVEYSVRVITINNEHMKASSDAIQVQTQDVQVGAMIPTLTVGNTILIAVISIVVVIVTLLAITCVILRRKKSISKKSKYNAVPGEEKSNERESQQNTNDLLSASGDIDSGVVDVTASAEATPVSIASEPLVVDPLPEATPPKPKMPEITSKVIEVAELENYVMSMQHDDRELLRKEYLEIPMGLISSHEVGKRKNNKFKNRFVNIIPYDHSRVELEVIPGDNSSDYINASYIDGYKKPRYYVAAQGCNKYTTQDMWRLCWQLKSSIIIMVTNLVENGKRKCEQYWPNGGEKTYSDITVRFLDIEETCDFVVRSFQLTKDGVTQCVKQYHFTAWPDHGVPTRAGPILAFRHKVRSYINASQPVIIHCSAGVGRTGTFIALDYLLEQAEAEGVVDVFGIVCKMRNDRVNMIQTVEQYLFVHDALLDALKSGKTSIACSTFREQYEKLLEVDPETGKSQLEVQFENLEGMKKLIKEDCKSALSPANEDKNRNNKILPGDRHRPYLMIRVDGTNDYINAVFLDGYRKRNAYIITQMPLGHTVIDFWRMIYEHNCQSIIMLNDVDSDPTFGMYWLDDEICDCGPFVIEPVSMDNSSDNITIREHKITYEPPSPNPRTSNGDPRVCMQFELTCWPADKSTPNSISAVVALIDLVERHQQKTGDGPVVIHCGDGASHSGLFAVVSCVLERMKLEQEVDIFHTIKQLRYYRPDIITDLDQYKFCHEVVRTFLAEFETYANFR